MFTLIESPKRISLKNALSDVLHVHDSHISADDKLKLNDCHILHKIGNRDVFIVVPEDNNEIYENLIRSGYSYAFVSLLQTARRNSCDHIHVSDGNDIVSGLHCYA